MINRRKTKIEYDHRIIEFFNIRKWKSQSQNNVIEKMIFSIELRNEMNENFTFWDIKFEIYSKKHIKSSLRKQF